MATDADGPAYPEVKQQQRPNSLSTYVCKQTTPLTARTHVGIQSRVLLRNGNKMDKINAEEKSQSGGVSSDDEGP